MKKRSKLRALLPHRRRDPFATAVLGGFGLAGAAASLAVMAVSRRVAGALNAATRTLDKVGRAADEAAQIGERMELPLDAVNAVVADAINGV